MYKSIPVTEALHWVGALDPELRGFDITMHTKYGTTYNSYILQGTQKTVLFETVKEKFFDEFLERIKSVTDPANIDIAIINHTEPDHSGALRRLLELYPNIEVLASPTAIGLLGNIINHSFKRRVMKHGDTLDIGEKTLEFTLVPFMHWPDTMFTYIRECQILVTCDGFGSHYASTKIFNDELEPSEYEDYLEAYRHYFNCLMSPFKQHVLDGLSKIQNLEISTICNAHGPIVRRDIPRMIELYRSWATPIKKERKRIIIAYVSVYSYTRNLAEHIRDGIKADCDLDVKLYDLVERGLEEVLEDVENSDGLLVGSPTLVGDTLPPVWALLARLNPFTHKHLVVGAFGTYGWSGEAVPNIESRFDQLKLKRPLEGLRIVLRPSEEDISKAHNFGKRFASLI